MALHFPCAITSGTATITDIARTDGVRKVIIRKILEQFQLFLLASLIPSRFLLSCACLEVAADRPPMGSRKKKIVTDDVLATDDPSLQAVKPVKHSPFVGFAAGLASGYVFPMFELLRLVC